MVIWNILRHFGIFLYHLVYLHSCQWLYFPPVLVYLTRKKSGYPCIGFKENLYPFSTGLPDFSGHNIPKRVKIYHTCTIKYAKWPKYIPNGPIFQL
jgi:hypothetical protein